MLPDPVSLKEAITSITRGESAVEFTNHCLEGPNNHPLYPVAFAVIMSVGGGYQYLLLVTKPDLRKETFQQRILGFEVNPEVTRTQCERVDQESELPGELADSIHRMVTEAACCSAGLPVCFILFGETRDGAVPTAHIYHPITLTTIECLRILQVTIRLAIASSIGLEGMHRLN